MKLLFIGGPFDGHIMEVLYGRDCEVWDCKSKSTYRYIRQTVATDKRRFDVMALKGMASDECLNRLINHYKLKTKKLDNLSRNMIKI